MAYNRSQVRNLLNASELELFESSLATHVKALSERQLRSKIGRVRTLRDKFKDLLRRQKLATRSRTGSKLGTTGAANQRTERKASVMAEVLGRYEARMNQLEAAQRAAAGKKAPAKKIAVKKTTAKKATAKATAKKTTAKKTTAKKATAKKAATKKTAAKKAPAKKSARELPKGRPAAVVLREALEKKRAAVHPGGLAIAPPVSDKAPSKPPQGSNAAVEPSPGRKAPRIWESGLQRIEGHIGTQVRRAQGKRDSRG